MDQPSRRSPRGASQRSSSTRVPSRLGLVPPSRPSERADRAERTAQPRPAEPQAPEAAAEPGTRPRPSVRRPRAPRPRFRLTRRATILALAVCAVVVTIAYPLQEYLAQRSALIAINRQNDALTEQVSKLQTQIALWSDPGFVAIQARAQLHYVKPGEEGFTVAGPANGDEQLGLPTPQPSPWYDKLWGSVKDPGATATP